MKTEVIRPNQLSRHERSLMLELMQGHYDGVEPAVFESDLLDKDWVIVLRDGDIVGFSTQKILCFQEHSVVFSGDTIIKPAYWGTQHLAQNFARFFFDYAAEPLYWFLISKGFKTYRFLPTFFERFYPRYDEATPPAIQQLIDGLGQQLFPGEYDPKRGVIAYTGDKDRLKPELQDLSERPNDPHFQFFARANPGYREGQDLACITQLSRDNLRPGRARLLFGNE